MPRRILEGKVVSDKMDKTVMVLVERRTMHPVYKKYIRKSDKYAAHDETNAFRVGDSVQIEECRPLSKRKSWKVITTPTRDAAPRVQAVEAVKSVKPKKEKAEKPAASKAEKPAVKVKTPDAAPKKAVAKKPAKKES